MLPASDSSTAVPVRPSPRPSSIASTSTLTLTPGNGLAALASSPRGASAVAPKLDLVFALARPSTSTSSDYAHASASAASVSSSSIGTSIASPSSGFGHPSFDRPRPSSSSARSYSTSRTSHTDTHRSHAGPPSGQSAEASLLAAKLRLSRSTSLEGSRSDVSTFDTRPNASSSQRSSFYGTAVSNSYNGSHDFARVVTSDDVFSPGFTRVVHAAVERQEPPSPSDTAQSSSTTKTSQASRSRSGSHAKGKQPAEPVLVRYVLPYGLSGPALEKSALNEALLAPAFEVGASEPTLASSLAGPSSSSGASSGATLSVAAQAAGLQAHHHALQAGQPIAVHPDGFPINDWMYNGGVAHTTPLAGPNAVPIHLVHGLTSTSSADFPLDTTELAAYETGLPIFVGAAGGGLGGLEGDMDALALYQQQSSTQHLVDPKVLRAIALTSQAAAVYRSHTVTRRFRDPFRESLERVARQSGRLPSEGSDGVRSGVISPSGTISGRHSPAHAMLSGRMSPHPRRGSRTAPGSPSSGVGAGPSPAELGGLGIGGLRSGFGGSGGGPGRPGLNRANTGDYSSMRMTARSNSSGAGLAAAGLFTGIVDAAEHPVRSLKRVWSGGLARSVFGMTRADEGAGAGDHRHPYAHPANTTTTTTARQGRSSLR